MGVLSSLLSCLGCSDGASLRAAQQQSQPSSKPSSPPRKSEPRRSASQQSQTAAKKPKPPVGPSRQSSRHKLDLPLEYCQDPDVDPEDSIIMGRKASYAVGDTQSSSRATSRANSRANSSSNLLGLAASSSNDAESHHTFTQDDSLGAGAHEVRLLHKQSRRFEGLKTLVLDLDETLVHSSFKFLPDADFIIPVEIEGRSHNVYVAKRPGVDEFLRQVGALFEVVVFTASVAKYGDPLLDHLDIHKVVHHRLFRESCYNLNGNYIKNLSQLGRPLKDTIIIDNSPASYALQPQNAVPVSSWFSDVHDNELLAMLPFLSALAKPAVDDVCVVLDVYIGD